MSLQRNKIWDPPSCQLHCMLEPVIEMIVIYYSLLVRMFCVNTGSEHFMRFKCCGNHGLSVNNLVNYRGQFRFGSKQHLVTVWPLQPSPILLELDPMCCPLLLRPAGCWEMICWRRSYYLLLVAAKPGALSRQQGTVAFATLLIAPSTPSNVSQ